MEICHTLKIVNRVDNAVDIVDFVKDGNRLVDTYGNLTKTLKGTGLHAHHLLEQRFASALGLKANDMMAVALTKSQHQVYTNRWRKAIGYGVDYTKYSMDNLLKVAQEKVYYDAPELVELLKQSVK